MNDYAIHLVCKQGLNHKHDRQENTFESGNWVVSEHVANDLIGGRIYLHERQDEKAWHGGKIMGWRHSEEASRKIFKYVVDGPFRIVCPGRWAQEKAVIKPPNPDRSGHFSWGPGDVEFH